MGSPSSSLLLCCQVFLCRLGRCVCRRKGSSLVGKAFHTSLLVFPPTLGSPAAWRRVCFLAKHTGGGVKIENPQPGRKTSPCCGTPHVCLSLCKGLQSTFGVWHDPDERLDYPTRCLKPSRVQVNHEKPCVVIALHVLELNCPHPSKTASTNKCRVHVAGGCKKQGQELQRGSARLWFLHGTDLGKQQERGGSGGLQGADPEPPAPLKMKPCEGWF